MRTITILAASAAALPCVPAMAQVSASGTTRLRVETTDGQARAGFNESDTLLNLRTTLAAQYEEGPVKMVGELWDSRVSGDNAGTPLSTGEVNTLELVQAYVEWKPLAPFGRDTTAPAGLYNTIIRSNLVSPGVRIEATPDKRTDLMASLRPFWLAAGQDAFSFTGLRDAADRSGSFAGTQFDGRVRHQLSKALRLELDAVLLAKGEFLRTAPNAPLGRWTKYVSLNATAIFCGRNRAAGRTRAVVCITRTAAPEADVG
jgi:hypothetical protein